MTTQEYYCHQCGYTGEEKHRCPRCNAPMFEVPPLTPPVLTPEVLEAMDTSRERVPEVVSLEETEILIPPEVDTSAPTPPTPPPTDAYLELVLPDGSEHRFPIGDEVVIGRFSAETGPVDVDLGTFEGGRYVSRRHCRIYRSGKRYMVEDLQSTNGTLYNGKPILTPIPLQDGDRLTLGMITLVFRLKHS